MLIRYETDSFEFRLKRNMQIWHAELSCTPTCLQLDQVKLIFCRRLPSLFVIQRVSNLGVYQFAACIQSFYAT